MGPDQACRQLREWHDQGFSELRTAVNLSAVQLHHVELPRVVINPLPGFTARSLELEVTETSAWMQDISTAAQHLLSLRRSGALIAIDDFGTGYLRH